MNDVYLIYDYDTVNEETRYSTNVSTHGFLQDRIVYGIHGGPMAGQIQLPNRDFSMYSTRCNLAVLSA